MTAGAQGSILRIAALAFGAAGFAVLAYLGYVWLSWPDVAALARENPSTTAFITRYESGASSNPELPKLQWHWVDYSDISIHVKRAVVVAEDIEFFTHTGFSTSEIRAAIQEALEEGGGLRGASTITQQLAKNLWLSPLRSPLRKFKEAILTGQLEKSLDKHRILEIYLNVVEFGPGVYGIGAAADHFFGKPASDLTEHQAALLAASLPRPSSWHPGVDDPYYRRYVEDILGRMERAEFLWRRLSDASRPARLSEYAVRPLSSSANTHERRHCIGRRLRISYCEVTHG
ncbi:MAG: monofunctional biosynthetic peptidoglycan transglycosylase [Gemmatimonadota bacterium]|nr:MAG: monofunctional biosynthetic peptidoglycan transglycosylase [Gemmatimonadota bacterium]